MFGLLPMMLTSFGTPGRMVVGRLGTIQDGSGWLLETSWTLEAIKMALGPNFFDLRNDPPRLKTSLKQSENNDIHGFANSCPRRLLESIWKLLGLPLGGFSAPRGIQKRPKMLAGLLRTRSKSPPAAAPNRPRHLQKTSAAPRHVQEGSGASRDPPGEPHGGSLS